MARAFPRAGYGISDRAGLRAVPLPPETLPAEIRQNKTTALNFPDLNNLLNEQFSGLLNLWFQSGIGSATSLYSRSFVRE
jgi:hypothetical protein